MSTEERPSNGEKKRKIRDLEPGEERDQSPMDTPGFEQPNPPEEPIDVTTDSPKAAPAPAARERGLLQSPTNDAYAFSEDDSIPTGGLFPRRYFKKLHRNDEVFTKGDVVSVELQDEANGLSEAFAQILCFFLNHKRFMQMQIKWLRPVAFSMTSRTKRGNPMPVSFTNGSMEKHPQPVEILGERIPWDKKDQGTDSNWEKERKDTFKKKRKEKAGKEKMSTTTEDERTPIAGLGEVYTYVGENIFLNPFDVDMDVERQADFEGRNPKDDSEPAAEENQEGLWDSSSAYPHRKTDSPVLPNSDFIRQLGHRSNPAFPPEKPSSSKSIERIPLDAQTLLALSLNAVVRQDIVEIVNHLDKRNDLWTSPLQGFLEALLMSFDSLDRVQLALKRLPPQGQFHLVNSLTPTRAELETVPYRTFCSWIAALRNTVRN